MSGEASTPPTAEIPPAGGGVDIATQGLARPAAVMAVATGLSRLTGLGRIVAMAFALGVTESRLADSYNLANTLPNVLYELALGGVLSSVFIPVLVQELRTRSEDDAWESVSALVSVSLAVLVGLAALTFAAAPWIMDLFANRVGGAEAETQRELSTFLLRCFAAQIVLYGFTAIAGGLLNSHGQFAVPMFAPVLNNLFVIAIFLGFAAIVSGTPTEASVEVSSGQKLLLGLGTTGGVAMMAAIHWPFLRRLPGRIRLRIDFRHPAVRKVARLSAWTLVYVISNTTGFAVSFYLANGLQGGVTAYVTAFAFFQLPIGIAAVSVATALMPKLSAHHVDADLDGFRVRLAGGIRITALLMLPATATMMVLAEPMVQILLQHGIVRAESADLVASTLRYFAIGLLPFAAFQLLMRANYARQDARTPALVNIAENAVTIAFGIALFGALDVRGLALAHTLGYVAGVAIAAPLIARSIRGLAIRRIVGELVKVTVASGAMALAMLGAVAAVEGRIDGRDLDALVQLAAGGIAGLAAFLLVARALRVSDLSTLRRLLPG